jgi:zinc and cadmium transporter
MERLTWILASTLLMSAIALLGGLTLVLRPAVLERMLLPMVALAAGALLGSAFFHMIPGGMRSLDPLVASSWLAGGFCTFLVLEQFLHRHETHRPRAGAPRPVTYLVLIGDIAHNLLDGVAVGSTFLVDPRAGIIATLAAAAHEVPQELGDFGVLVHGGWSPRRALAWNVASALTFPIGALFTLFLAGHLEIAGLVLFGAGSFIYIAASDLIPEIKAQPMTLGSTLVHFGCFAAGLLMLFAIAYGFER